MLTGNIKTRVKALAFFVKNKNSLNKEEKTELSQIKTQFQLQVFSQSVVKFAAGFSTKPSSGDRDS